MADKEKFSIARFLKVFLPVVAVGCGFLSLLAKKTNFFDKKYPLMLRTPQGIVNMEIPVYNPLKLPPGNCSGYARRAAGKIFNKRYSFSDAWNRKYTDELVARVSGNKGLEEMEKSGFLKPGMIIGVYSPDSEYKDEKDMRGKKAEYTHILLYLGKGNLGRWNLGKEENNEMFFADLFGNNIRVTNLEGIEEKGLEARAIIDSWN